MKLTVFEEHGLSVTNWIFNLHMKELFDTELSQRLKMSPILSENKNVEERWFRSVQTAFHLSPSHFSTGPNDDFIDIAFVSSETSFYQFAVS